MNDQISHNDSGAPPHHPASSERVVSVEIDELVIDGFGPLDSRPVSSRRPDSRRAAEAFRRELARELAGAGPAAGPLAQAIADAVFRQLLARPGGGAR